MKDPLGYWFGFLSSDDSKEPKFVFPEGTDKTLIKWFNNVYNRDFTVEETRTIWENIYKHPEIEDISSQIWDELETLYEEDDFWKIL